jgi:hypothetical protein
MATKDEGAESRDPAASSEPILPRPSSFVPGPPLRRGIETFHHAAPDAAGRWWLIDPRGEPFFCRGVHGVRRTGPEGDAGPRRDSAVRLRTWGFNATGVGGDNTGRDDGFAFMAAVDFFNRAPQVVAPRVRLPDVFDPAWPQIAAACATECRTLADNRQLLGWVTDDGLAWGQGAPGDHRPTLLQLCLSLEPSSPAYHAAWEFALAVHGGRMEALERAWAVALPNKEVVRELTRAERGIATRGYLRDEARWTREFARRYFTTTANAIRAVDSNHLVLGCRFRGPAGPSVLAECVYPAVDVALLGWHELPPAVAAPTSPVLVSDLTWTDEEFLRAGTGRERRLTSIERMLRRGRMALERLARHPAVVGYVWAQWQDEPAEQPPFARGLVHPNGAEAQEHTELLRDFNPRAELLRRAPSRSMPP